MPGTAMKTSIITDVRQLHRIEPQWQSLWERAPATTFQRPEWLLPWVEIFEPRCLRIIAVWQAERLVALAPLLIYQRDAARILAFIGGGVSDYLDILVDRAFLSPALSAIFLAVDEFREEWDAAEFTDLPGSSPLLQFQHADVARESHALCPVLHIADHVSQLAGLIPARQFRNLRNARNRTHAQIGRASCRERV